MGDVPILHSSIPIMARVMNISSRMRIGVYDCLYMALAEREGCQLITSDQRLINSLGTQFPFILDLAMLP